MNLKTSILFIAFFVLAAAGTAEAASLRLTPSTGVYEAGATFTATVQVVTSGSPVNAAEGTLSFNPNELSVVSVNRNNSVFNLWIADPTFSNSAGTVSFSGGVPSGYSGAVGNVLSVTFRARNAGSPRVSFTSGSVLANDGRGTNILTSMNGGSYTVGAVSIAPEPERIIEYVAPANTPGAPVITSDTHADPDAWHNVTVAQLSWNVPTDITAVRTLLDESPSTIPTKVYEDPISTIKLEDLPEGESYFHLQFQNADGWGAVTHYRLAVDTVAPTDMVITQAPDMDPAAPEQTLQVSVAGEAEAPSSYVIKLDAQEPYEYIDETASGTITLPALEPGYHTVIVEAFDRAGNSVIGTYSFTIEAFDKPVFTDIPSEMSGNVIPVIRGLTRPYATVELFFKRLGSEPNNYQVTADETGVFTFVPEGELYSGVYELSAVATDQYGAKSTISDVKRIAVQEPGYIRLGGQLVDAMSIVIPLVLMTLLLLFGIWYSIFVFRRFRGAVQTESVEALDILHREFGALNNQLQEQAELLKKSRKTKKLTKAEDAMVTTFGEALSSSQAAVEKEIKDVTLLSNKD